MKIKCVKLDCEVCGKPASIQLFINKSGAIKYARARHYIGRENNKPQFEYHQQTLSYISQKLGTLKIGHNGHTVNDDLEKPQLGS